MDEKGEAIIKKEENVRSKTPWWHYPKLQNKVVKALLVSLKPMLLREISRAFIRLGHECRILLIGEEELETKIVEQTFTQVLKTFKPDFLLTINHLGFDREGLITSLLTYYHIPFASWYVDSPDLIIHHYLENKSPYLTLFLWDRDYLEVTRKMGFLKAEYLPLGVDECLFRPIKQSENQLNFPRSELSFVGNSMLIKVQSVLKRNQIRGLLLDRFYEVARSFLHSEHLLVKELIKEAFPELWQELKKLPPDQIAGYETAVIWQATSWYRAELIESLSPFEPLIVGDKGWLKILAGGFRYHPEVNYYAHLPFLYNSTRINFNATSRQMKNGVNQRVFDIPACRALLITDWASQLEELMEPGREVLTYRGKEELRELVERVRKDRELRERVAEAGYRRVLNEHTYLKRVRHLIEVMRRNYG